MSHHFLPIDKATSCPGQQSDLDAQLSLPLCRAQHQLERNKNSQNHPLSWGYTIFRTIYKYGSDEAVAEAVKRLAVYAKHFARNGYRCPEGGGGFDDCSAEDLWSHYYSEVVENRESLANASVDGVGEQFDAWIRQHQSPATTAYPKPNGRFTFCLMLDEQSLDNILGLPEDPVDPLNHSRGRYATSGWVKVIANRMKSEEEKGEGRYWLRVGVSDYLWPTWFSPFDPDYIIEEMAWVDAVDGVQNLWGSLFCSMLDD
jgi:hypothetical protein